MLLFQMRLHGRLYQVKIWNFINRVRRVEHLHSILVQFRRHLTMSQKFVKTQKLEKWIKWMEIIQGELVTLFSDVRVFWEVQNIIRENTRIQKPNYFYSYLARSYISHALVGLRRQIKPQKDSVSFVGLLEEIAQNPDELSFNYYHSIYMRDSRAREFVRDVSLHNIDIVKEEFSKYADPSGKHVCPQMVKTDLSELKKATKACEDFTDRRVAHRDKRDPKIVPTYEELDDCIKLMDKTYVKYHYLFFAEGMTTLNSEPQYDWKAIFREPWLLDITDDN